MRLGDKVKTLLRPLLLAGPDDEYDPFADDRHDSPPPEEGDDRVHAQGMEREPEAEQ